MILRCRQMLSQDEYAVHGVGARGKLTRTNWELFFPYAQGAMQCRQREIVVRRQQK